MLYGSYFNDVEIEAAGQCQGPMAILTLTYGSYSKEVYIEKYFFQSKELIESFLQRETEQVKKEALDPFSFDIHTEEGLE